MRRTLNPSEAITVVLVSLLLIGLTGFIWLLANAPRETDFTAQASTRPARATRQALTQTAVAKSTRSFRQTRRSQTATSNNAQVLTTEEPQILPTEKAATPTRDPRTPTPDPGTPEPTGVVIVETVTPYPSATLLPSIPPQKRSGLWVENLQFGNLQSLEPALPSAIPNFKEALGGLSVSPDGSKLAVSVWTGETTNWKGAQNPVVQIGPIPLYNLYQIDLNSGDISFLTKGYSPIWSPNGEYIAYTLSSEQSNERRIEIINSETLQVWQVTLFDEKDPYSDYAWLSPTELIYYNDIHQLFDVSSGESRPLDGISELFNPDFPPAFFTTAPDASILAIASVKEIFFLKWQDGKANLIRKLDEGINNRYWSLSPDGDVLAFSTVSTGQLKLEKVFGDAAAIELPENVGSAMVSGWSPDSISVIYQDRDGARIVNRDSSGLDLLPDIEATLGPVWAKAGAEIIWVNQEGQLFSKTASQK